MKVKAYFNLHKRTFSIVAMEGDQKGRVIGYADTLHMEDVEFKVSEAGRQRVLREQTKNVHAYVVGNLVDTPQVKHQTPITYNPYKYNTFVVKGIESPVYKAKGATLQNKQIVATL